MFLWPFALPACEGQRVDDRGINNKQFFLGGGTGGVHCSIPSFCTHGRRIHLLMVEAQVLRSAVFSGDLVLMTSCKVGCR